MTVELKKGYTIDSYYDKYTRSYITTLRDEEGNQIGDAFYCGNMTDRDADVQYMKEIFFQKILPKVSRNMPYDPNLLSDDEDDFPEPVLVHDDDEDYDWDDFDEDEFSFDESLKDKSNETRRKTKKEKLPALSTLSPIIPDPAAGISTFNSGVGLSEEWIHRDELESRLKKMGFKYKFNKYTDEQLYKIYKERLSYLDKKKKEKEKKKQHDDEVENKRINSKDSFMKNDIEFESEDAAKEYFGESMDKKVYWNTDEIEDTIRQVWKDSIGISLRRDSINISRYDNWCFVEIKHISDWDYKHLNKALLKKSLKKNLGVYKIEQSSWRDTGWGNSDYGKTLRYDMYMYPPEKQEMNESLKVLHDQDINIELPDRIVLTDNGAYDLEKQGLSGYYTWVGFKHSKNNRGMINKVEDFIYDYLLPALSDKFNVPEEDIDVQDFTKNSDMFRVVISKEMNESMNNKFYLNDMHRAWDIEEDISNRSSLNEGINKKDHNFKTINEGLRYFERKAFNQNNIDLGLELLYESNKNNLDQNDVKKLSNFLKKADDPEEVNTYIKGLLSEDVDDSFDIRKYYNLANDILSYVSNNSNIWQSDLYDVDKFGNNVEIKFYVKGDWKHDHWHFDVMLKDYLKENYPDISYETWNEDIDSDDEYDSDYYPGIHVLFIHLDRSKQEDNDEPLELKLVDDESINESIDDSVVVGLYGGDETFYYPEDFYSFINKCKKAGLAVSNETYDDLGNWELTLTGNGNTIYKLSRDLPGYFNSDLSPNEWIDEYRIDESLHEEVSIEDINVEDIQPQQKDYDRAKGLQFRGKTFKGSGEPFGSEASKMAKLIKDPIKLVRRAKAIAATYGADEGYMSNTGYYHYEAPDKESDVWGPFKKRLVEFGFTRDQINSIKNFKPLKESLNEDINRYSDIVPYEDRKYWYFTTHGVGPGTIPKDLHILEIREGQNDRGTWGDFVCLDGVLNTSELQKYDLRELAPSDNLNEDWEASNPIDNLVSDLVSELSRAGFIIDEASSGITDNIMGGKHLQVINPNMFYPTSETEGEDITEDDAYRLFRDDLKDVEGVLDTFEDEHRDELYLTFNFGPNKDNVITGGIDVHPFRRKN